MIMNRLSVDIDSLVKLYKEGRSVDEISIQFGVSRSFAYNKIRKAIGGFDAHRIINHPKTRFVIDEYMSGMSENAVAIRHGLQRNTVKAILVQNGIKRRSQSEAEMLKWSKMTEQQRIKQVKKAHQAIREKPPEFHARSAELQAISKQKSLSKVGDFEMLFIDHFNKLGFSCIPQRAFGAYNIDIAIGNTAIEIHSNDCLPHNHAYYRKRIMHLLESNWNVIYVKTGNKVDVKRATSNIGRMINLIKSHKPVASQYGMIRGSGDLVTSGCLDGDQLSVVSASDGFFQGIE